MFSPTRLAWTCALGAMVPMTHATPMLMNPVTPNGYHLQLSESHPALGRELSPESYVAPIESRASIEDLVMEMMELGGSANPGRVSSKVEESVRQYYVGRRLEASSVDIQRIEQHFQTPIERNVGLLPKTGVAIPTPWPSSYWPVYQDGINVQWAPGQPSPAEKYALAFGLNATEFEQTVSMANGILSMRGKRPCTVVGDCESLKDGSTCAKRQGEQSGFCVPMWFGLCHAWAPAAMMEPEPKCPVTVGTVTFQPFDIKALLTELYDGTGINTVFTGARFNGIDDEPDNRDEYGRFRDPTRRDLGPGYFHVAVTNILGFRNQTFILDVDAGVQVWNQPVASYQILEMTEITVEEAARSYFKTTAYPFNPVVQKMMYVKNRVTWVLEGSEDGPLVATQRVNAYLKSADYEYLLELDEFGNILGGEWVGKSVLEHPDFLWFPAQKPALNTISRVGLSYQKVSEILQKSITSQC